MIICDNMYFCFIKGYFSVESLLQSNQLIHDASKRPHVRFVRVELFPNKLRAHVVQSAAYGVTLLGQRGGVSRQAHITDFHRSVPTNKQIPSKRKETFTKINIFALGGLFFPKKQFIQSDCSNLLQFLLLRLIINIYLFLLWFYVSMNNVLIVKVFQAQQAVHAPFENARNATPLDFGLFDHGLQIAALSKLNYEYLKVI